MSFQNQHIHSFERLSSELGFKPVTPSIEEIMHSASSSLPTFLSYKNVSSGETLEGSFFLEKSFLIYYQRETMRFPKILVDFSYARLQTSALKISFDKDQTTYEIVFEEKDAYDDWMLRLKRFCILTNFEKKYQIAGILEKRGNFSECLVETKMGGYYYSAKMVDKKYLTSSENLLVMIRLMNEIEILKVLGSEEIPHLHEVHETKDSIYLITDFIHNLTLNKVLKAAPSTFPVATTKTTIYQLLKTLADMASMNIAHRNIKPSSILMEGKNNIRVINFGLATFINGPEANVGICGTPGYIAPEILHCQREDRVYNDKADVFSAGCIFFEILFGYPLFKGSNASKISCLNKDFKYAALVQVVMKEQSSTKSHSAKLGLDLLLKLLHSDPKQRISAKDALRDAYFKSQESFGSKESSEDENETRVSPRKSLMSSPQNARKTVGFNPSPSDPNSLRESFSEALSHFESSTLYPSNNSLRKSCDHSFGRPVSSSPFKTQPKFKSAEEMKLLPPPKRLSVNIAHGTLLQKADYQNEEELGTICDEPSPLSIPKKFPGIRKYQNQFPLHLNSL